MISYNLALELKQAGFPQDKFGTEILSYGENGEKENGYMARDGWGVADPGWIKVPTLSELIEAVGDRMRSLSHDKDHYNEGFERVWIATRYLNAGESYGKEVHYQTGKTPEEAVAKLYLSLHGGK
jgi:hypothetical protein